MPPLNTTDKILAALASGLPTSGIDATGATGFATVVTAPARQTHYLYVSVENNGAVVSLDGGSTEHFTIPADTISRNGGTACGTA